MAHEPIEVDAPAGAGFAGPVQPQPQPEVPPIPDEEAQKEAFRQESGIDPVPPEFKQVDIDRFEFQPPKTLFRMMKKREAEGAQPGKTPAAIAARAIGDLFSSPLGLGPRPLGRAFEAVGLKGVTEGPEDSMSLVRRANDLLIRAPTIFADLVLRALGSIPVAVAGGVAEAAAAAGADNTQAKKIFRDVIAGFDVLAISAAVLPARGAVPRTVKVSKIRAETRKAAEKAIDEHIKGLATLPEEQAVTIREALKVGSEEAEASAARALGVEEIIAPDFTPLRQSERLNPKVAQKINAVFEEAGIPLREDMLISDQIMQSMMEGKLPIGDLDSIMLRHGISRDELAGLFRSDIRFAAQTLGRLSGLQRRLKRTIDDAFAGDKQASLDFMDIVRGEGLDGEALFLSLYKRIDNTRRAFMVSQPATAARNAIVAAGRVGLDLMQDAIDISIQSLYGRTTKRGFTQSTPLKSFGNTLRFFARSAHPTATRRTKQLVDDTLEAFPAHKARLFLRYSADISRAGLRTGRKGVVAGMETAADFLNVFNRTQEWIFRRAKFASTLDRRLRARGISLDDVVRTGKADELDIDLIEEALQDALDFTFAKNPSNRAAKAFVKAVHDIPGLTFPIPFPRFITNALRFQYQYSPLPFVKIFTKAERAKFAAGDTSTISKAIVGTTMWLAARQIRDSKYGGERWMDINVPGVGQVDARPFNPFVYWLYLADLEKRVRENTLDRVSLGDIVRGMMSFSPGINTGMIAVDKMLESVAGMRNVEEGMRAVSRAVAQGFTGFLVPLGLLSDFYGAFDAEERVVRDTRNVDVAINLTPLTNRIPGVKQGLEELQIPTRAAPPIRQDTVLRQLTGMSVIDPKNSLEKEMDRLGWQRGFLRSKTGVPLYDRLVDEFSGELAELEAVPFVERPDYKSLPPRVRSLWLTEKWGEIRTSAREMAFRELLALDELELAQELLLKRRGRKERGAIEEIWGRFNALQ